MIAFKNIKIKHVFLLLIIMLLLMFTCSCSLFGGGSNRPVVAPKIDEKSLPRLERILPDYTNEDGKDDYYADEDSFMPANSGEKLYLVIDYINKDNLPINKVILTGGGREIEVPSRDFKEGSNSNRTTIELIIESDEPGLLTYTVKRILYNARSSILDMRLLDESLMTFVVNVDPVFTVILDYQNGDTPPGSQPPDTLKEERQVPYGTPLNQIIPALNAPSSNTTIPEKAGGWTFRGYFIHPDGLGLQVKPLGKFFFWDDIVLYAHYERLYNFTVSNASTPIPYVENGEQKEYKRVATITKKTGAGDEQRTLEIYDTIADDKGVYPIVAIESAAFDNTSTLTTLKIGRYLKEIGPNAFFNSKVQDIEFHTNGVLEKIGDQAFMGTSRLGTGIMGFTLPRTIKYLGDRCFEKSGWGKMVAEGKQTAEPVLVIYDNLTHIGNWCFRETKFEGVLFTPGVKFKADAIKGENYLISHGENGEPIYADSDYYIGWCLFKNCNTIKWFKTESDEGIANALEIIPDGMFDILYYNSRSEVGLTSVILGEGLKRIGKGAFHYQKLLTSIKLPATLADISGDNTAKANKFFDAGAGTGASKEKSEFGAFHECLKLSTIEFAEDSQLKIIGMDSFYNNESLRSITFTSKVLEEYGDGPFRGCSDLTAVTFKFDNPDSVPQPMSNGRAILGGTNDADLFYASLQFKVFVEDNVVDKFRISLGKGASSNLKGNLPVYGASMRKELRNSRNELIAEIILEETRSILDDSTGWRLGYYHDLIGEKDIYLPDTYDGMRIVSIGPNAFNKDVERIRLPQYISWIEPYAFNDCKTLTEIIYGDIVSGVSGEYTQTGLNYLKRIGDDAFYNTKITYFRGGNQLSEIGEGAFKNCTALIWVDLRGTQVTGENAYPLGKSAFWKCGNLRYIRFPLNFKQMSQSLLADCRSLEDIVFENSGPTGSMFSDTTHLQSVPASVNIWVPENTISLYQELDNFPRRLWNSVIEHYNDRTPEDFGYHMPAPGTMWWNSGDWSN